MSTLRVGADGVAWPPVWADGIDATISELTYRLRSVLGDVPGDETVGLPYFSNPTPIAFAAAVRAQAEATTGVTKSIVSFRATSTSLAVTLTVEIAAAGQTVTRTLSTEVYAGLPSAWYLRAGG